LFIYDKLAEITDGLLMNGKHLGKWQSKASAVAGITPWFNKITEETITAEQLLSSGDSFLEKLGTGYNRYSTLLHAEGYLDFSFILRDLHELLVQDSDALERARTQYDYFMVDEYQDTNFVQEEVLLKLSSPQYNITVVGDDDQALYRFRGGTVRNILEFPERLKSVGKDCQQVALSTNYRSHPKIIAAYLQFMKDGNWISRGKSFRTGHNVAAETTRSFANYPAVLSILGDATAVADVVEALLHAGVVSDASQIAILFKSVAHHAPPIIAELRSRGVEVYAPRARQYLEHEEVQAAIAVLWALFRYVDSEPLVGPVGEVGNRAEEALSWLTHLPEADDLTKWLTHTRSRILALQPGEDMKASLLDLLYQAFRFAPLANLVKDPIRARNLGYFTQLLRTFQLQFRFEVVHAGNRKLIPWRLWAAFFYLLETTGVDDIEDEGSGPPLGMVQVMTIHQAKGLEFPVVIVGSLEKRPRSAKEIDRVLGRFYPRGSFEPANRQTEFDARREFYVAFSRAKHLLIAFSSGTPNSILEPMIARHPTVAETDTASIAPLIPIDDLETPKMKPLLSLTSHINVYRRCSRQYAFYSEYGFAPSFAAQVFFGTVVHQTIEDIHRHVLDRRPEPLNDMEIERYFIRNSELLRKHGVHPLAPAQRDEALRHVMRYFIANRGHLSSVVDTEVEVTLEQADYILNGRIDLIRADDGALELVDFKAQKRIDQGALFEQYRDQLSLYRHLVTERYRQPVNRTVLYFTGEESAAQARLVVDVSADEVGDVVQRFDVTAHEILRKDFELIEYPPLDTCRACDFKHFCERSEPD
jgi:DNA helicase-2/ATP-dependent DNA helicase PcrA